MLKNFSCYLSIKKTEAISFENVIGTYKQLFCSVCSTYCCNLHNIKEDNFCFDNPEIHKMDNFLHSYKSLIYTSILSKKFSNENKIETERKKSNSPNSASDAVSDINYMQKINEDYNKINQFNDMCLNVKFNNNYDDDPKEILLSSKQQHSIHHNNSIYIPISDKVNSFKLIDPIMNVDIKSIIHNKNERIYNNEEQIMTSSTISTDDKLKANIFHGKINQQVKEFNKIIDLNKLQTTYNKIDVESKILLKIF